MREMEGGGVVVGGREQKKKKGGERNLPAFSLSPPFFFIIRQLPTLPLLRSTIGVVRFNFSVRNG